MRLSVANLMRRIILMLALLALTGCAALNEMGETAEPPVKASNQYTAVVKAATRAKLIREPWNYFMGILSAATNEGIDLRIEEE